MANTMFCAPCARPVEPKRQIGALTVFFAVITAGISLLAVPFYRKRCPICRSAALTYVVPGTGERPLPGSPYARITQLEQRLRLTEADLDAAHNELDQLRKERDFYHELLEDPVRRRARKLQREAARGSVQRPGPNAPGSNPAG